MPELKDLTGYSQTVVLAILFVLALRWLAPHIKDLVIAIVDRRKEVLMRQMDVQEKTAEMLGSMSETLRVIGVDQRRKTDGIEILQRVGDEEIRTLGERLERLEKQRGRNEKRREDGEPGS